MDDAFRLQLYYVTDEMMTIINTHFINPNLLVSNNGVVEGRPLQHILRTGDVNLDLDWMVLATIIITQKILFEIWHMAVGIALTMLP